MRYAFFAASLCAVLFLSLDASERFPLDHEPHARLEKATFALG